MLNAAHVGGDLVVVRETRSPRRLFVWGRSFLFGTMDLKLTKQDDMSVQTPQLLFSHINRLLTVSCINKWQQQQGIKSVSCTMQMALNSLAFRLNAIDPERHLFPLKQVSLLFSRSSIVFEINLKWSVTGTFQVTLWARIRFLSTETRPQTLCKIKHALWTWRKTGIRLDYTSTMETNRD